MSVLLQTERILQEWFHVRILNAKENDFLLEYVKKKGRSFPISLMTDLFQYILTLALG